MNSEYDENIAAHYSAYRPPLHELILEKCIPDKRDFQLGLDVGCGTGYSAIALTRHCTKVIGIDPSTDMLERSISHPKIQYSLFNGKDLEFKTDHFDVITFAGSLYYAKSQNLLDEVVRVSKLYGKIIVYDFEVMLDDIFPQLNIDLSSNDPMAYNHQEDFSGLMEKNLLCEKHACERINFKIHSSNLAHLLLSFQSHYPLLTEKFGELKLEDRIVSELEGISQGDNHDLKSNIYYKVFNVIKN